MSPGPNRRQELVIYNGELLEIREVGQNKTATFLLQRTDFVSTSSSKQLPWLLSFTERGILFIEVMVV